MDHSVNRRDFLGQFAAAGTALALGTRADAQVTRDVLGAPKAPDGQVLKAGLIGCGGRGRGAMINFLDAGPNLQLTALADLFPDRLEAARQQLKADKGIDVPANRCFTGFDAHQKLIDSGVDIVLNCTPPHFRPMHFAACVEAGKHCFLEKPVGVDAAGVRSVLATSEKASSKGLAVMTGTQLRREQPRMEVRNRVIDGAIGDILSARAFRNQGALWYRQRQAGWSDMEYMIRDWVNWTWLSGDIIVVGDESKGAGADLAPWHAFVAPGSGIAVRAKGGPARLVLVAVTAGEGLAAKVAASKTNTWTARPAPISISR